MNKAVNPVDIVTAILKKDLRAYGRNKVYLFLTVLSLVFFVLIFYVIPDTVEETITLGMAPPMETLMEEGFAALLEHGFDSEQPDFPADEDLTAGEEGIELVELENEEQLKKVIEGEKEVYKTADGGMIIHDPESATEVPGDAELITLDIGIAFPPSFMAEMIRGEEINVKIYTDAAVPEEIQTAMEGFVREMAYRFAGRELPVELPDEETIILGVDRAGEQVSMRERMRPLLALFILLVETFAMASLISGEVLQRTVTALRVTPMKTGHFLAAKTIFGTGLALVQGLLILALVGAFTADNWLILILTMFIGSVMFTSVAMIIGAGGKDFMGELMYAMLFTVPLMIPAFTVLFPGSAAAWVQAIPSYPIISLLMDVTVYDAGWAEASSALAFALAWVVVLYAAGLFILKRKVETL